MFKKVNGERSAPPRGRRGRGRGSMFARAARRPCAGAPRRRGAPPGAAAPAAAPCAACQAQPAARPARPPSRPGLAAPLAHQPPPTHPAPCAPSAHPPTPRRPSAREGRGLVQHGPAAAGGGRRHQPADGGVLRLPGARHLRGRGEARPGGEVEGWGCSGGGVEGKERQRGPAGWRRGVWREGRACTQQQQMASKRGPALASLLASPLASRLPRPVPPSPKPPAQGDRAALHRLLLGQRGPGGAALGVGWGWASWAVPQRAGAAAVAAGIVAVLARCGRGRAARRGGVEPAGRGSWQLPTNPPPLHPPPQDGTEKARKVFVSVPTEVGQTEAEEIGVEHLLRNVKVGGGPGVGGWG
jgi:hypothetical protein